MNSKNIYFSDVSLSQRDSKGEFGREFVQILEKNSHKLCSDTLYSVRAVACIQIYSSVKSGGNQYRSLGSQVGYYHNPQETQNWSINNSRYARYFGVEEFPGTQSYSKEQITPSQFFDNSKEPYTLVDLFARLNEELIKMDDEYDLTHVDHIKVSFTPVKKFSSKPASLRNITINKPQLNRTLKQSFSEKFLPLSLDESKFGNRINFSTISFNRYRFYSTRVYVNEAKNRKYIVKDLSAKEKRIELYDLISNKKIQTFIDSKINNTTWTRRNENNLLTIEKDKVIKSELDMKFTPIKYTKGNTEITCDQNLGSFDIETFKDNETGIDRVYALGFSHVNENIDNPIVKTYYLEPKQSSEELVITCINEMLKTKYHNTRFYTHNLGGFDVIFILKILCDYNQKAGEEVYKLKTVHKDNRILKLSISSSVSIPRKKSDFVPKRVKKNTIHLVDSLSLLPDSLDNLSKSFATKYKKTYFPYSFVNNNTLYYIGKTPDIQFYNSYRKNLSEEIYNSIHKADWNLKEECLLYLKQDLLSLLHVIFEFNMYIFNAFNIEATKCLTITGIAINIFLKNHYSKPVLPLINKEDIYNDIKKAYFGGLSEVYKPYGENLNYYDVNSLYPYVALNPMPGSKCIYIKDHSKRGLELNNLFGYFYASVKTTQDDYLGLLPIRKDGLLTHPLGEWSGWYFSEHLKFVKEQGYEIKVHEGYNFNKVDNVFKSYIENLYEIKANSKGSTKLISKFLLNSLLGRFGMHINRKVTELMKLDKYQELILTHEVHNEIRINETDMLVTYTPRISESICNQHFINYLEALNSSKSSDGEFSKVKEVSIPVAGAVTSYANIYMSKIKLLIKSLGGSIYYMDTDSIVTNIELPEHLIGNKLGQFKAEYLNIKRAYFITSKTYCLITKDDKVIIKAKGVFKESLTEEDFKALLKGKNAKAVKGNSVKNYGDGYVSIGTKSVLIQGTSYVKRIKVYDEITNVWTDTKPLKYYVNTNLALIIWENKFNLIVI